MSEEVQRAVWLQLQSDREVGVLRDGLRRRGRGSSDRADLRTSFNSTLLWKLQLPLSRLVPRSHPSASALFATQTTPAGLPPRRNQGELKGGLHVFEAQPKPSDMFEYVCTCVSDLQNLTCKKRYPKTFGEDKKTYARPYFNIFLSLHNQDYSKVY